MKLIALIAALTMAQTPAPEKPAPEKKAEFIVASIHPAQQDGSHDSDVDGGLYRTHNLTLKRLIANAYGIDMSQVLGGPNWIDSDGYDITAKIPPQFVGHTRERMPEMLQSLLEDRFHLAVHREARQVSGFALVVAKKGPKMQPAKAGQDGSDISSRNFRLTAKNATMEAFAKHLSRDRSIGQLVVDKTGLTGGFDFELAWTPDPLQSKADAAADAPPSIFTALQEQLGLRLESAKVPVMAVVVDRAEKPEGN